MMLPHSSSSSPAEGKSELLDPALVDLIDASKDEFASHDELLQELARDQIDNRRRRNKLQAGLLCAVTLAAAWAINPVLHHETFTTEYFQRTDLHLSDGSRVHLNANTEMIAELRLRSREMHLIKGEASFQVAHGLRPFNVHVDQAMVHDIGTVFNIMRSEENFITTVQDGAVEIRTEHNALQLDAGQGVMVTGIEIGHSYLADLDRVTAWQSGRLVFNGTPLKEVVSEIQRYRANPITLDADLGNYRVSGRYDILKIDVLLDSLPSMFPVKLEHQTNGTLHLSRK